MEWRDVTLRAREPGIVARLVERGRAGACHGAQSRGHGAGPLRRVLSPRRASLPRAGSARRRVATRSDAWRARLERAHTAVARCRKRAVCARTEWSAEPSDLRPRRETHCATVR